MKLRDAVAVCGVSALLGCGPSGTGGDHGTGGVTGTGGTNAAGGATGTGGITNAGGAMGSGGAPSSGGATGTGGLTNAGGSTGVGGSTGAGGATGSGGVTGTGGGAGSGGATGAGGVAGVGGTGGAGGTAGAGGTGGTAGSKGQGGSSGASGAIGQGGSSGTTASGGAGGLSCPGSTYDAGHPPQALTLSGSLGAHDPAAYVLGGTIYLAATGLIAKTSANLTTWSNAPTTAAAAVLGGDGDRRDQSCGRQTSRTSAAFTTSTTRPRRSAATSRASARRPGPRSTAAAGPTGGWCSARTWERPTTGTPSTQTSSSTTMGRPGSEFGSFWSGLKMVKLDPRPAAAPTPRFTRIANGANSKGSLEGGWVFERCGYYYLFSSWGSCCSGAYDYNIRVGRSRTVIGPYVDKAGTSLMAGGGTLLVQGNARWVAPGHNAVITYDNKTYNIYHALDGGPTGAATLRISEIAWDANGWPVSGGP